MKNVCFAAVALTTLAGIASADVNHINGLNFNTYENFQGNAALIPSTLRLDGGAPAPQVLNGSQATTLGDHSVREVYPAFSGGFSNRHELWASDDGGNTAYGLQAGESFRIEACFRMTAAAPYPVRVDPNGPPPPGPAAETGIWIHNHRHDSAGNAFVDEGGIWGISNGTGFSAGAGMDFYLMGEGNGNPNAPRGPIFFTGDVVQQIFTYYAPGYFGPGSHAGYEATMTNLTRGISASSGLLGVNTDGSGVEGFGVGTTFGFRFQNAVFPIADTDITTDVFHIRIIPAPGAAALLGLGGLVFGRRRR